MQTGRNEVTLHVRDVRRWCLRRSGDPHLADDVSQDTALAALMRLDSLRDPLRLRGWLFRIAQRRLVDAVRRRRGELQLVSEPVAPEPEGPDQEQVIRAREEVQRVLMRLSPFLRKPVRMHYLEGQPLAEVATRLNTTRNGIKSRLYRARQILREKQP